MKQFILTTALALFLAGAGTATAQEWPEEYLGLPGDNLNLYAVMNLFRESETLEVFERKLNDPEKMINNLDLNGDNMVDYLMVIDYPDDNIHNIVLRVALSERDYQDVAVFTIEKFRNGSVAIQLVGDEALYGRNYIVEPAYAETPNPGYQGRQVRSNNNNVTVVYTTYNEVAAWPVIIYMRRPGYRPWHSAWYWGFQPVWWSPWHPHYWHYYYGYHYNWHSHYYAYYRPWGHHRCNSYHTVYYSHIRSHSNTVIVNVNNGRYRDSYSRPEKLQEGKQLFVQRHPDKPIRQGSVEREDGRYGTAPASVDARNANQLPARSGNELQSVSPSDNSIPRQGGATRTAPVEGSRNGALQATPDNRRGTEMIAPTKGGTQPEARPATRSGNNNERNNSVTVPDRRERPQVREERSPEPRPERQVTSPSRESRNSSSEPSRVNRSSSETNRRNTPEAPARVNQRSESRPAQVERSRPATNERRESNSVRTPERSSNNNRSGNASNNNESRRGNSSNERKAPERR